MDKAHLAAFNDMKEQVIMKRLTGTYSNKKQSAWWGISNGVNMLLDEKESPEKIKQTFNKIVDLLYSDKQN